MRRGDRRRICAVLSSRSFSRCLRFRRWLSSRAEASGQLVLDSPNLADDRIVHDFAHKSSSGVQMMGTVKPLAAHTLLITGRMAALAKWRSSTSIDMVFRGRLRRQYVTRRRLRFRAAHPLRRAPVRDPSRQSSFQEVPCRSTTSSRS